MESLKILNSGKSPENFIPYKYAKHCTTIESFSKMIAAQVLTKFAPVQQVQTFQK